MSTLTKILEEMKNENDDIIQQLRETCDKILSEEIPKMKYYNHFQETFSNPNMFLYLEVPSKLKKKFAYLILEREMNNKFIAGLWEWDIAFPLQGAKRCYVWEIRETKPEKILLDYLATYKILKGE